MTVEQLKTINIGEAFEASPLMKLGGLNLGGVKLTLSCREVNTSSFSVDWLSVRLGFALADIRGDKIVWTFDRLGNYNV